jgi:hypothetical protein
MHLCLLLQVARHPLMGLPGLNEQSSEVSCVLCWFNMHTLHTTAYINISLLLIMDGFMMVGITTVSPGVVVSIATILLVCTSLSLHFFCSLVF